VFSSQRMKSHMYVKSTSNSFLQGHLNPKWTKWIHKNIFPCVFGRSCIIPNIGYISEAAASYLDRRLELNVCPRTEVVSLASPSFYYSASDMHNYRNGVPLPNKMGSFQLFLKGFKDATTFFRSGYDQVYKNAYGMGSPQGKTLYLIISRGIDQQESITDI
jgi:hypothetical protein